MERNRARSQADDQRLECVRATGTAMAPGHWEVGKGAALRGASREGGRTASVGLSTMPGFTGMQGSAPDTVELCPPAGAGAKSCGATQLDRTDAIRADACRRTRRAARSLSA